MSRSRSCTGSIPVGAFSKGGKLAVGKRHRHGVTEHEHPHEGPHDHGHVHSHDEQGHSHGLLHDSIKRSHEGLRAVLVSLGVLALAASAQAIIFVLSGSVALLADLIHNVGDALTAVPLGIAFLLRWSGSPEGAPGES